MIAESTTEYVHNDASGWHHRQTSTTDEVLNPNIRLFGESAMLLFSIGGKRLEMRHQ